MDIDIDDRTLSGSLISEVPMGSHELLAIPRQPIGDKGEVMLSPHLATVLEHGIDKRVGKGPDILLLLLALHAGEHASQDLTHVEDNVIFLGEVLVDEGRLSTASLSKHIV
jgi:hypothetical protein